MNRLAANTFAALIAVSAVAPVAVADNHSPANTTTREPYTPFELVRAAYDGKLPGIPGFGDLITSYELGRIESEDLVKAAISEGRLTPDFLENHRYLRSVDHMLDGLRNR